MQMRIYSVDQVDLSLEEGKTKNLQVSSVGRSPTSGWSNPALVAHIYVQPPKDGVQDFDFVAVPPAPDAIVLPVLTPITADHVLIDIDVDNYWAPGLALTGVRCHATANSKEAKIQQDVDGMPNMQVLGATASGDGVSYATGIMELFRPRDVLAMERISGWNLHNYEDVVEHADTILARLSDQTMPCDGSWPKADIDLFAQWIEDGKKP